MPHHGAERDRPFPRLVRFFEPALLSMRKERLERCRNPSGKSNLSHVSPHLAGAPSRQHATSASSSLSSVNPITTPVMLVAVRFVNATNLLASTCVRPPSSQTSSHPRSIEALTALLVPIRPEMVPSNFSRAQTGNE